MSSDHPARTFAFSEAVRAAVPIFVGLIGSSSSGKTKSALRLATGMQRVYGGKVFVIDTEGRRALHYAPRAGEKANPPHTFQFTHVPFSAPFGPGDYLAAIEQCAKAGAKVIVIDSMSHEHEGPGGVLERQEREAERLSKLWKCSIEAAGQAAWQYAKAPRKQLINTVIQLEVSVILCFRGRKKTKPGKDEKGKSVIVPLGWMPIGGEDYVYEMTMCALLYPGCGGVPTWTTQQRGEKEIIKLPDYLSGFLAKPEPLSEAIGEQLASWAKGGEASIAELPQKPDGLIVVVTEVIDEPNGIYAVRARNCDDDTIETYRTQHKPLAETARGAKEVEVPMILTYRATPRGGKQILTLVLAPTESDDSQDAKP